VTLKGVNTMSKDIATALLDLTDLRSARLVAVISHLDPAGASWWIEVDSFDFSHDRQRLGPLGNR
jgi:hypothetical protein